MRDCGEGNVSNSNETMEVATEMVTSSTVLFHSFVMFLVGSWYAYYLFIVPGELTSLRQACFVLIANRVWATNTTFLQCKLFSKYIMRYSSRITVTETTAVMHFGYSGIYWMYRTCQETLSRQLCQACGPKPHQHQTCP